MAGVLHVGFYNYVTIESVVALIDYKIAAAKNIVRSAKSEKPRSVVDVTLGRKAMTLVILTGDRYVISAIHRKQLANRLDSEGAEDIVTLDEKRNTPSFQHVTEILDVKGSESEN